MASQSGESPQTDLRREVAELKSLVQNQREEINQLQQNGAANLAESLGLDTPHGRRQAMKYVAGGATLPALLAYASSEGARADAAGADLGTQADPWDKVWAHAIGAGDGADVLNVDDAIVHENEAVNTATTIGNVTWVYYDSALGSFTITIPASLESKGVVLRFIDETSNAGTNSVDITSTNWNIAGSGSVTLDADDHVYEIFGDGGAWLDQRFLPTVEAGSIATGELTLTPVGESNGVSFSGGQTQTLTLGGNISPSDSPIITTATPANDPDNDHGYSVDQVFWDDSTSSINVVVSEVRNSGGGEADVVAWSLNTP